MSELPRNWEPTKLGNVTELLYGKGLTKINRKHCGTYPVYGSNGAVGYHDEFLVKGPVIIVGRKGAAGIPTFAADNCWPIDTTYYVQESPAYDLKFMYYLLLGLRLDQFDRSTAIPGLNRDDAYALDIGLPPLNEQKRIVAKIEELFSELDKGIENLKTARQQLKIYRQAVLKHAFEGKLTANWREKNKDKLESADELLERIPAQRKNKLHDVSAEELNKFPQLPSGWKYARLGYFMENIKAGKSFKCDEREPTANEIGVAKVSAVTWGEYDERESKTCINPDKVNPEYFINQGDFLFSRANTIELVGACVIANKVSKKVMLSDKTLRIQFKDMLPRYFLYYLRSQSGRTEIMERSTGNQDSMRNIGQERIRNIVIPVCSHREAEEIDKEIQKQFSLIKQLEETIDAELQKSEALRQSILKRAFSGKLVGQDPRDEPASVLLERIKAEKNESPKRKMKVA